MPSEVLVLGHRNPDTDSVCAAIGYAYLKNWQNRNRHQDGSEEIKAVPGRLGTLNPETSFVLDYFGVPEPVLVPDVKLRVSDVMKQHFAEVGPQSSLFEVGRILRDTASKTICVVDAERHLLGIVTAGDVAKKYLSERAAPILGESPVWLHNLLVTLGGHCINTCDLSTGRFNGEVVIAALATETIRQRIRPGDIVLVGDRVDAQLAAIEAGAGCLIITGGYEAGREVQEAAASRGAWLISVPHDTYTTGRLISLSLPVATTMNKAVVTFHPDELVEEVKKRMAAHRHRSYPVVDDQNKLVGLISRGSLIEVTGKQVILVDHNEKSQAVEGLHEAEILEIVDHHRLGDVQTLTPVLFRNEPVGSTSTIVAGIYEEVGCPVPREIAGILMAAILSDTLLFKSPTCTARDRAVATRLAVLAGVDMMGFGAEMLRAGSSLKGMTPREILGEDFKEFRMGPYRVGISQVETMNMSEVEALKAALLQEMESLRQERGYVLMLLMVTDLLREGSEMYVVGRELGIAERAFGRTFRGNSAYLAGVMSRKKQVVPALARAIEAPQF